MGSTIQLQPKGSELDPFHLMSYGLVGAGRVAEQDVDVSLKVARCACEVHLAADNRVFWNAFNVEKTKAPIRVREQAAY